MVACEPVAGTGASAARRWRSVRTRPAARSDSGQRSGAAGAAAISDHRRPHPQCLLSARACRGPSAAERWQRSRACWSRFRRATAASASGSRTRRARCIGRWATIEPVSRPDAAAECCTASSPTPRSTRRLSCAMPCSAACACCATIRSTALIRRRSRASAEGSRATLCEWARPRLDGAAGYALSITVENGEVRGGNGAPLTLSPSRAGEPLRLAHHGVDGRNAAHTARSSHLLSASANDDPRSRASAEIPELRGEVSRRFLALQHLLRPRHVDVAAPADAGAQPEALERGLDGGPAAAGCERRSRTRRRHRRVRRLASSQAGRCRRAMRRSTTTR